MFCLILIWLLFFVDSRLWSGLMIDDLRIIILILSFFLTVVVFLNFKSNFVAFDRIFFFLVMGLQISLLVFFSTRNLLVFFIRFEFAMLPILFMILGYGYQVERIQAFFFLLCYIVLFSTPILIGLLWIGSHMARFSILVSFDFVRRFVIRFILVIVFLVKTPVYFVHFWLPKAHVEAPVMGSIYLAGILLKLGGYGWFRVSFLIDDPALFIGACLFMFGLLCAAFLTTMQVDRKALVAFSSVGHITLMFLGIVCLSGETFFLLTRLMLSHGLVRAAMFSNVNTVRRFSFRRMFYFVQGFGVLFYGIVLLSFLIYVINFSVPLTVGFVAEVFVWFFSLLRRNSCLYFLLLRSVLICYSNLILFYVLYHGKLSFSFLMRRNLEVDFCLLVVYSGLSLLMILIFGQLF